MRAASMATLKTLRQVSSKPRCPEKKAVLSRRPRRNLAPGRAALSRDQMSGSESFLRSEPSHLRSSPNGLN